MILHPTNRVTGVVVSRAIAQSSVWFSDTIALWAVWPVISIHVKIEA